jgi:Uma2 family endonuclease
MTAIIVTSPPVIIDRQSSATWEDYIHRVENSQSEQLERVFFNCGVMWVEDMGNEGINHARFNKLFTLIFGFWFARLEDVKFELMGGCVLEKPTYQGAAPDEVVYIGGNAPRYQSGARRVNLNKWRVPDLAVEIADTTLASDLDEKKQLYLTLEVPEYWVVDVRGKRVLAFRLVDGKYQECIESVALTGLPIELLDRTLERMEDDNGNVAIWFASQIKNLPIRSIE